MLRAAEKLLQLVLPLLVLCYDANVRAEIEHNTINEDGSYSFRHSNDDIGGYYHSASASPDNIVRGRYGSRNPGTGQVEEVVYTAGPRGFRANGPKIHRKMDLAQFPVGPRGSPDDPLADPYDDPSYSFSYRSADQSRSENSDATGRVRGLYSYLDDVGERHSVRYAAGAGTGFEVLNAVPDNPVSVAYAAPLYKAHPKTRGKMTVQRGPDGSYKLIAAGPDHRRAESRGSDGLVRGTYSYLDDVGVQRTVEYIAGAGIGYRIVKNRMGPGTHINPSIAEFRLSDTDFKLTGEFGRGAGGAALGGEGTLSGGGGGGRGGGDSSGSGSGRGSSGGRGGSSSGAGGGGGGRGGNRAGAGGGDYLKEGSDVDRVRSKGADSDSLNDIDSETDSDREAGDNDATARDRVKADRMGSAAGSRGSTRHRGGSAASGSSSGGSFNDAEDNYDTTRSRGGANRGSSRPPTNRNRNRDRDRTAGTENRRAGGSSFAASDTASSRDNGYSYDPPSANNYHLNDDDVGGSLPPLITANRKILEIDRERDWVQRHRDSTVIKNVGKWYIGLPPGQSVRAHVQNIDLLPLGGRRVPSPSEALRQDEIADMVASMESEGTYSS